MPSLLTIAEADPDKVYIEQWDRSGPGWVQVWIPAEGLDPDHAEIIHAGITFGKIKDVFIQCGECKNSPVIRLFPGVAIACSKCFTVYRLEVVT